MRLSDMSGFHHESNMPVNSDEMRFVQTDPYHFMLVGGNTPGWVGRSEHNWLRWNDGTLTVEHAHDGAWNLDKMAHAHDKAPAVAVPIGKARIKSCAEPYMLPAP